MTIEELNKLIKEELHAFFEAEDEEVETPEADGDDDIEVTTDEPAVETGDEALDLLRQIYDMIKPEIEGDEAPEMDMDEPEGDLEDEGGEEEEEEEEDLEEAVDNHTFFRGDNVNRTTVKAKDVQGTREKASLKEGFEGAARLKKLANIKK
jgi:hypothetical protein